MYFYVWVSGPILSGMTILGGEGVGVKGTIVETTQTLTKMLTLGLVII